MVDTIIWLIYIFFFLGLHFEVKSGRESDTLERRWKLEARHHLRGNAKISAALCFKGSLQKAEQGLWSISRFFSRDRSQRGSHRSPMAHEAVNAPQSDISRRGSRRKNAMSSRSESSLHNANNESYLKVCVDTEWNVEGKIESMNEPVDTVGLSVNSASNKFGFVFLSLCGCSISAMVLLQEGSLWAATSSQRFLEQQPSQYEHTRSCFVPILLPAISQIDSDERPHCQFATSLNSDKADAFMSDINGWGAHNMLEGV